MISLTIDIMVLFKTILIIVFLFTRVFQKTCTRKQNFQGISGLRIIKILRPLSRDPGWQNLHCISNKFSIVTWTFCHLITHCTGLSLCLGRCTIKFLSGSKMHKHMSFHTQLSCNFIYNICSWINAIFQYLALCFVFLKFQAHWVNWLPKTRIKEHNASVTHHLLNELNNHIWNSSITMFFGNVS